MGDRGGLSKEPVFLQEKSPAAWRGFGAGLFVHAVVWRFFCDVDIVRVAFF